VDYEVYGSILAGLARPYNNVFIWDYAASQSKPDGGDGGVSGGGGGGGDDDDVDGCRSIYTTHKKSRTIW
jgi:hypothetical protein